MEAAQRCVLCVHSVRVGHLKSELLYIRASL